VQFQKSTRGNQIGYWFAFHPHQKDFFSEATTNFVAFGCGDKNRILLIPAGEFLPLLAHMNTTQKEDRLLTSLVMQIVSPSPMYLRR
jgi:hypothetical protein